MTSDLPQVRAMAVVVARQRVCAGATRVGEALRRKHAWPRSGTDCASDAGGGAACAHHHPHQAWPTSAPSAEALSRALGAQRPQTRFFVAESAPNSKKIPKARGSAPGPPAAHRAAAVLRRVGARGKKKRKKKRTPSGDGMGSACHVWVFRAKREKFFEALFGVTLHHLNLDPASSPEALMPARSRWAMSPLGVRERGGGP